LRYSHVDGSKPADHERMGPLTILGADLAVFKTIQQKKI